LVNNDILVCDTYTVVYVKLCEVARLWKQRERERERAESRERRNKDKECVTVKEETTTKGKTQNSGSCRIRKVK
jgi:hypothetical protein